MSLHFKYGSQPPQEETKIVSFLVTPLMCEKCIFGITKAFENFIPAQNLSFNPAVQGNTGILQVTVPTSMTNDQIIGKLQKAGRKAEQYFPAEKPSNYFKNNGGF